MVVYSRWVNCFTKALYTAYPFMATTYTMFIRRVLYFKFPKQATAVRVTVCMLLSGDTVVRIVT